MKTERVENLHIMAGRRIKRPFFIPFQAVRTDGFVC